MHDLGGRGTAYRVLVLGKRKSRRRTRAGVAAHVFGVVVLMTLSSCSSEPSPQDEAARAEEEAAEARAERLERQRARQTAVFEECTKVMRNLSVRLDDLDSRLSIGLQFDDYSRKVGDAQVAYDKVIKDIKRRDGVSGPCLRRVGTPLENALNAYVNAYNVWNDCIGDYDCSFDGEVLARAQKSWAKAARLLEKSSNNLDRMQPPSGR